jgi:plasmid stabilization system protein ParE
MKIVTSELYEQQLKKILVLIAEQNPSYAKDFKTYLDAIILNIPTKEKKYKKSFYFDDEDIKDIPFQGCTIIFYVDKSNTFYIVLGITAK